MGRVPVRLREVVYTVSPFEVTILNGLFKDFPAKVQKNLREVGSRLVWGTCCAACRTGIVVLVLLAAVLRACADHRLLCCLAERLGHCAMVHSAHRRDRVVSRPLWTCYSYVIFRAVVQLPAQSSTTDSIPHLNAGTQRATRRMRSWSTGTERQ